MTRPPASRQMCPAALSTAYQDPHPRARCSVVATRIEWMATPAETRSQEDTEELWSERGEKVGGARHERQPRSWTPLRPDQSFPRHCHVLKQPFPKLLPPRVATLTDSSRFPVFRSRSCFWIRPQRWLETQNSSEIPRCLSWLPRVETLVRSALRSPRPPRTSGNVATSRVPSPVLD